MKPTPFDYRQDITLLRVTIDGLLNSFQDERLQLWFKASKKGASMSFDAFGQGDRTLEKFVPARLPEIEMEVVNCTAKDSRLSAYVFCQTRDLDTIIPAVKAKMAEELESRKIRFDNIQKHLDLWM